VEHPTDDGRAEAVTGEIIRLLDGILPVFLVDLSGRAATSFLPRPVHRAQRMRALLS